MDLTFSEEQKQIISLVKDFCQREIDPKRMREIVLKTQSAQTVQELRDVYPYDLLEKLHAVGLRQLQIPQKYGGTAPDNNVDLILTLAAEEMGYWGGEIVDLVMIPWIFLRAIATNRYVTDEQRKWIFSQFIKNPRMMIATAVTEPAGGTDIHLPYDEGGGSIMQVTAYKDGNEWVINGDKMFCSACGAADLIMVAARTDKNAPVSKGITFFWVPVNTPGVSMIPNRLAATNLGGNCQTHYENVRVSESQLIGRVNEGFTIIESFFLAHLPGMSGLLGVMQSVYERLRIYASQRWGGGKPLIQHTGIALKLGEMAVNLEASRSLFYRGSWQIGQAVNKQEHTYHKSGLFWFLANYVFLKQFAWHFCEMATDIYGGLSASLDLPLSGLLNQIMYIRAAGLTVSAELIKAGWEYPGRYADIL